MSAEAVYLDSSALVRLVVAEPESAALRQYLEQQPLRASCGLAKVEVPRAVRASGKRARRRAQRLLDRLNIIQLDDPLMEATARLGPEVLRSLDAIHLAAALEIGDQLEAVVTYDERMARSAEAIGLAVEAPA